MNHIHADKKRNAKTRFFYSYALKLSDFFSTFYVEGATYSTCGNAGADMAVDCFTRDNVIGWGKIDLSEFFIESHLLHQSRDESVHLLLFSFR